MINITDEEEALVSEIGHAVVWQQQKNMVLSVWCLIAAVLLQHREGITIRDLTETVRWLKRHANNVGSYIDWPGECFNDIMKFSGHRSDGIEIISILCVDRLICCFIALLLLVR